MSYRLLISSVTAIINLGCVLADDDDDNSDDTSQEALTFEIMHRIAASSIPGSAEVVKYFTEERQKHFSSRIQAWQSGLG
ncbi:hypothetical protein DFH29DRAFT_894163 [Suillus ampliporus]|nr:hypothetical protein DFH29DRAFT_894163 [Suillus ampliporus]